jgi:hypothetical protein
MSPRIGEMLLRQIRPIIRACLAKGAVRLIGAEDLQELESDGIAQAANMLESAERAGKEVKPNSVAFYAIQSLRSGRRFGYSGRMDAMCPAAALDGNVSMLSMDEPFGMDDDSDEELTLHTCLASSFEDPQTAGAREIDWELAMDTLGDRERMVVMATARGTQGFDIARELGVSQPRIVQMKRQVGCKIREALGADVLADVMREPGWKAGMRAAAERREGRYERAS